MNCPHCKKDLHLPSYAMRNMDSYSNPCVTITLCCGNAVYARPVVRYETSPYDGPNTVDDWGKEIKQREVA